MGKNNYIPQAGTWNSNRHQQPILPDIFLLVIKAIFILLQMEVTFMRMTSSTWCHLAVPARI